LNIKDGQKEIDPLTPASQAIYDEFSGYCSGYSSVALAAKLLGYSVSFAIVIVNIIFKTILIGLIKWIGEDTHSQQLKTITNGIFVT
jgi:hypothetical protein